MGVLRKVLIATPRLFSAGIFTEVIPRTFNFTKFTVEAELSGWAYPAAENDSELALQDAEGSTYEDIASALVKVIGGDDVAKVRVVNLKTQNITVRFDPKSANAGQIDKLTITFE